jgi:hypothetical protein
MIPNIPWKLIGYGLAALAVVGILWWLQSRIRISYQAEQERDAAIEQHQSYKAAVQASAAVVAGKLARDQQDDADHSAKIEQLDAEADRLRAAASKPKPTVETTDENGVARVSINPVWWLCNSALLSGDPADTAACEARSGSAAVQPRERAPRLQVQAGVLQPQAR